MYVIISWFVSWVKENQIQTGRETNTAIKYQANNQKKHSKERRARSSQIKTKISTDKEGEDKTKTQDKEDPEDQEDEEDKQVRHIRQIR